MTPIAINTSTAAKSLGGQKLSGDRILCPGPGHGKRDRSLHVAFDPKYPEGFVVHSFTNDDWRECRDHVRSKLGLPEWKPTGRKSDEQPTFVVREFVYRDSFGDEYHRIDQMSDGGFKHFHWDIDGWARGAPPLLIPYELPDVLTDETIWLVRGELNAELLRDGFNVVATTYPSGFTAEPDPSFLHHFAGRDVRILDVGGALSAEFTDKFSSALSLPVHRLPDGFRTLRQYAQDESASADGFTTGSTGIPVDVSSERRRIKRTPFTYRDPKTIPPRQWLYGSHLQRRFVSLTAAPGGLGKSSLELVDALAMAVNRPLFPDMKIHGGKPLNVWYWNGEDPDDENERRVAAAIIAHGINPDDLIGTFSTDSGRDQPLMLCRMAKGEIEFDEELFVELEQEMIEEGVDVFIIDPLVSIHEVNENDNSAVGAIIKRLSRLAERTNSAVSVVHHVRKPSQGSTAQTDINDARGAGALLGGVRSARILNVMPEDIADAAGIPSDMRLRYFSVADGAKANMSPKTGGVLWRFLDSVSLGNITEDYPTGDSVGVVTFYDLPKEARSTADLSKAEDAMRLILSTDDTVRHWEGRGRKPKNWLGHRLLDALQVHDGDHDQSMQRLITGWLKDGLIITRSAYDESRNRNIFLTMAPSGFVASDTQNHGETLEDPPF